MADVYNIHTTQQIIRISTETIPLLNFSATKKKSNETTNIHYNTLQLRGETNTKRSRGFNTNEVPSVIFHQHHSGMLDVGVMNNSRNVNETE